VNSFYPADPVISRGSCYRTFSISASGPYSGIHAEFIAFTQLYEEFNERDCELLRLSIDGVSSPIAWVRDIEEETSGKNPSLSLPLTLRAWPSIMHCFCGRRR
jgi:hypothetical protein